MCGMCVHAFVLKRFVHACMHAASSLSLSHGLGWLPLHHSYGPFAFWSVPPAAQGEASSFWEGLPLLSYLSHSWNALILPPSWGCSLPSLSCQAGALHRCFIHRGSASHTEMHSSFLPAGNLSRSLSHPDSSCSGLPRPICAALLPHPPPRPFSPCA